MKELGLVLSLWSLLGHALISVEDPSDLIPSAAWAADNAIVPDYNVPFIASQPRDLPSAYVFETDTAVDHETYSVTQNDTDVMLVANGSTFEASFVTVLKEGYSSNLLEASFYGFNAAINVANASTANLDHINVTVHNGAANIYAYGTDTVVNVKNAWLYSSGPVSHGLYASGNGTIIGRNIQHYSGGHRSSAFSGDNPAGDIYVYDSVSRVAGIGSATFYALGIIYAENVLSVSENGPVVFSDGPQSVDLINCDATAGLLGGVAMFSSMVRQSGAKLNLQDTKLTTLGDTVPGLWFGNVIVDVTINATQIITDSDVLIVANYSQITQDFNIYASYADSSGLQPAEVFATVMESNLSGDLVAYNQSYITFSLTEHSSWIGAAYSGFGDAFIDVSLDKTSNWTLTRDSTVQNLTCADSSLSNIDSAGFTIYYNTSALQNGWLNGSTMTLTGGGRVVPIE